MLREIFPPSMFARQIFASCAALLILTAGGARAEDVYVNNVVGDDRFDGSVSTNVDPSRGPFRTLARALRWCHAGDRILLANTNQPYRESVSLVGSPHSGTAYQPFVIEGQGATLDGSAPVPADAWQFVSGDVFRFQPERKQYQQLFLNGVPAVNRPADSTGISLRIPNLEPKQWALVNGWIYFRVESGSLPQDYSLTYTRLSVGLTLYKVDDVLIHNLVVQRYELDGINLHDATGPCRLLDVTCRENGRAGVAIVGASEAELHSCEIGSNGKCQLLIDDYSRCDLFSCQMLENPAPLWQLAKTAKLSIDGKPVLMGTTLNRGR